MPLCKKKFIFAKKKKFMHNPAHLSLTVSPIANQFQRLTVDPRFVKKDGNAVGA
jgi:hypothetical protein